MNPHPSASTWLQIIRYVTLQSRLNTARKNANIQEDEGVNCLVSLGKCLQQQAKASDIAVATIKECLKEELLEELSIRFFGDVINPKQNRTILTMLLCMNCVDIWCMLALVLQIAKIAKSRLLQMNYICQMIF